MAGIAGMAGMAALALCGFARAADLATICREALVNNAGYRAAEAQYASVEEQVPEKTAAMLPSLSVSADTLWNSNNSNTLNHQAYNSNGYTVTLIQPLWRRQNSIAVHEARTLVDQASAQLDLARQKLLIHTAQAYFDVLFAQDALTTFKEQRAADLQQLDRATRGFDVGAASITDVHDAKARYDLVTAQEISAANDVASKTQALRQIIDQDPGRLAPLRAGIVLKAPVPDTLGPWEMAAQTNNASVLAAEAALHAATLEEQRSRAARLPTLDLVATHGLSNSATNITVGTNLHANTIGLQFSVPIFSGGGTLAKVRENEALVDKASADLDDARRSGVLAVQQAYLGTTSGLAQVRALEEAVKSANIALESNRRGVAVGTRINVDVLNAQQALAVTERDLAKSRYDTLMALLRLKASAGSLGAVDIDDVNTLLQK
ncbi:MAG TPA: TolC family outer membrane protein [Candidatus Binataceae bacterium]|nr:TolC family outer membrane protein [Candidatus Binataceae bacterium]